MLSKDDLQHWIYVMLSKDDLQHWIYVMLSKDDLQNSSLNPYVYDLKVASSHTNINENFANNVLKTKA